MISNIQALRAVAAFIVAIYHVQPMIRDNFGGNWQTNFGAAGVDIFFIVSGFVMVHSCSYKKVTPMLFLRDRVVRIYPLWWAALAVLLFLYFIGFQPAGLHSLTSADVVSSIILAAQVRSVGTLDPILTLGWTLVYEVYFYMLFALCLNARRLSHAVICLGVYLGATIVLVPYFTEESTNPILRFYANPIMLEFFFGCVLGLVYTYLQNRPKALFEMNKADSLRICSLIAKFSGWAFLIGGFALILGYDYYTADDVVHTSAHFAKFGLAAFLIVSGSLMLEYCGCRVKSKWVLLLGSASYSLYLFHMVIMQAIIKILAFLLPRSSEQIDQFGAVIVALTGAIFLSIWIHMRFEVPITSILKRTLSDLSRRRNVESH